MFSKRTDWHRRGNRIREAAHQRAAEGRQILDLTETNPTRCGFAFSERISLAELSRPENSTYMPDPRGLLSAREAVAQYYADEGADVHPDRIFLTAGTTEAYSHILRLMANPGDSVATGLPGYPLLDLIADLNDVRLTRYSLHYDDRWWIDEESVAAALEADTRCLVLVSPNNPTGSFVTGDQLARLASLAAENNAALVSDEVFRDYRVDETQAHPTAAVCGEPLAFTLGGLSKALAMPQMKLSWITVSGPEHLVNPACARLEIIADTYLSAGIPVQHALPAWLANRKYIQDEICGRIRANDARLRAALGRSVLRSEGGWSAVIRVPRIRSDEDHVLELLNTGGVLTDPGLLFGFASPGYLVISLLPTEETFEAALPALLRAVNI